MKTALLFAGAALLALAASGCRDEVRLTVLFSGDDRGWVVPAG